MNDLYITTPRVINEGIFPYMIHQSKTANFIDAFVALSMSIAKQAAATKTSANLVNGGIDTRFSPLAHFITQIEEVGGIESLRQYDGKVFLKPLFESIKIDAMRYLSGLDTANMNDFDMFFRLDHIFHGGMAKEQEMKFLVSSRPGTYFCSKYPNQHIVKDVSGWSSGQNRINGLFIEICNGQTGMSDLSKFIKSLSDISLINPITYEKHNVLMNANLTGPTCPFCDDKTDGHIGMTPEIAISGFLEKSKLLPIWLGTARGIEFGHEFIKRLVLTEDNRTQITKKNVSTSIMGIRIHLLKVFVVYAPTFNEYLVFNLEIPDGSNSSPYWLCHRRDYSFKIPISSMNDVPSLYRLDSAVVIGMVFTEEIVVKNVFK